jgi:hypothetical protein
LCGDAASLNFRQVRGRGARAAKDVRTADFPLGEPQE